MAEMIWTIGFDRAEAKRAGKEAGKAQSKEADKDKGGGGAFAGGLVGSLLGSLLSSVQALFTPLSAISGLLVATLFPILKPFLILFIKVGILLYKWLNKSLAGLGGTSGGTAVDSEGIVKSSDSLKSALFLIGAIIGGIAAAFLGAPALIIAAAAILGGLLLSTVGGFLSDVILRFFQWIDNILGTNFLEPLRMFFDGVSNIWNGLWNTLKSLLSLDFKGVWEGLKQMLIGVVQVLGGVFGFAWEFLKFVLISNFNGIKSAMATVWDFLKSAFIKSFEAIKTLGSWIANKIKGALSSILSFGRRSATSVNDAIITPSGDIIRTNPSDYLIATKTPGALGGSGGSSKIDVNINGGLITEDVARQIGKIIMRTIKSGGSF